jgi:hypothetical protein
MPLYAKTYAPLADEPIEDDGLLDEFAKGFGAGVDQTQALGGGFLALAGSAFGNDDWFYDGLDYYNEQMAEAAENEGSVQRVEDIEGAGDLLAYTAYTAGNLLPSIAGAAVSGGVGAAGAKFVGERLIKSKLKDMADELVKKNAKASLVKKIPQNYKDQVLAGVGQKGAVAGAVGFGSVVGGGENFMRQLEENGEEAPGIAFATGIVSGSLDALVPLKALKRILPEKQFVKARNEIGEKVLEQRSLLRRMATEGLKSAGMEGLTEATQEFVQNASVGWVKSNLNPEDQDAFIDTIAGEAAQSAYLNAFVAGAIGGGTVGSLTGIARDDVSPPRTPGDNLTTDDLLPDDDGPLGLPSPEQVDGPRGNRRTRDRDTKESDTETQRVRREAGMPPERDNPEQIDPDLTVDADGNVFEDNSPEAKRARATQGARAELESGAERQPRGEGARDSALQTRQRVRAEEEQERLRVMIEARRSAQQTIRSAMGEGSQPALPEGTDRVQSDLNDDVEQERLGQIDQRNRNRQRVEDIDAAQIERSRAATRARMDSRAEPLLPEEDAGPLDRKIASAKLESYEGATVSYQGIEGVLSRKSDGFYITTEQGRAGLEEDVFIEGGEGRTLGDLGITVIDRQGVGDSLGITWSAEDSSFTLRGRTYSYQGTVSDENGNTIGIRAADESGSARVIRTKDARIKIERLKIEAEQSQAGMDAEVETDVLPPIVQKKIKDKAEAENIPMPDAVSVQDALDATELAQAETDADVLADVDAILTDNIVFKPNPRADGTGIPPEVSISDAPLNGPIEFKGVVSKFKAREETYDPNRYNATYAGKSLKFEGEDQPVVLPEFTNEDAANLSELMQGSDQRVKVGKSNRIMQLIAPSGGRLSSSDPEWQRLHVAIQDLIASGMPKQIFSMASGLRISSNAGHEGAYNSQTDQVWAHNRNLKADSPKQKQALRFTLAHEFAHALDNKLSYAQNSPEFAVAFESFTPKSKEVSLDVGEVIGELYQQYTVDSPIGRVMFYPFMSVQRKIANGTDADIEGALEFLRSEVFAQSLALFIADPKALKQYAPKTFAYMQKLRRDERITNYGQDSNEASVNQPDNGPVREDVRTPPEPGSPAVDDTRGDGPASRSSPVQGEAGAGVGGTPNDQARNDNGQAVRGTQSPEVIERGDGTIDVTMPDGTEYVLRREDNGDIVNDETGDVFEAEPGRASILDIDGTMVRIPGAGPTDIQEMVFADLTPEGQQITASNILYNEETLDVQAAGGRGKIVLADIARALDAKTQAALDGKDLSERTEENAELISDVLAHEAAMAMMEEGNAGQWYQEKIAGANRIAEEVFPELSDPATRTAFTLIQAITSNGASVPENSQNTFDLYSQFRETQRFPEVGFGKETPSMVKSFQQLNKMLDAGETLQSISDFMSSEFTVKDLKSMGYNLSGENMGTMVYGSAILGPKIGQGFYQNLQGNYDPLTMDRWFMRTWGRVTGTMMADSDRKLPAKLKEFKEEAIKNKAQLREDGVLVKDLRASDEAVLAYALRRYNDFQSKGFKDKSKINAISRQVFNATKPKESPGAGSERVWIRQVMGQTLEKLNSFNSNQEPVNMGALQAILWYPEKNLTKQLGVGNARSEPTDYETEFRKIADARQKSGQGLSGPSGPPLERGAGDLQQEPVRDDRNEDELSSQQNENPNAESQGLEARPAQTRDPVLQKAVQDRIDRKITAEQKRQIFEDQGRPLRDMTPDQVPELLSDEKAINALTQTGPKNTDKPSKQSFWMASLIDGDRYGVRLDIPSYTKLPDDQKADIVTVHKARKEGSRRGGAGTRLSYRPSIRMTNVDFIVPEAAAASIATGQRDKSTIATIEGTYVAAEDSSNRAAFIEAMSDSAWTQISMNPERSSEFYDMQGNPVRGADEMIQFGNLVIAKNVNSIDRDPSSDTFGEVLTVDDILYSMAPEIQAVADKVLSRPEEDVTVKEKASRYVKDVKTNPQGYLASKWQGFVQGVFDDVNRIGYNEKQLTQDGKLKDGAESAYKAALWTKNLETTMQAVMFGGPLELRDGAFQMVEGEGSFYDIFEGYDRNQLKEWELWAAANRAKRLKTEDRENLFSQKDINTVLKAAERNGTEAKYKETLAKWTKFNRKILDLAEQSGILDPQKRATWDRNDYVPFFRFDDEADTNDLQNDSVNIKNGLMNQGLNIKRLEGGEGKINPLESMVSQLTTMIDRSFKNEAMRRIARDNDELGTMVEVVASAANLELANNPAKNDLIKVYDGGKARVFQVKDPMLMRSIGGLGGYQLDKMAQAFAIPKQVLTRSVTIDPGFMIANAFRDMLASSVQFPNAPNPLKNIAKAMKYIGGGLANEATGAEVDSFSESKQSLMKIMASGGLAIGDFYGTGKSDNIRSDLGRINSMETTLNTPEKIEAFYKDNLDFAAGTVKNLWNKWNRVGQTFEQASRINVFEGAIANGETHAEAVSQAADVLNFSMRGDFWLIKHIVNSYPFMNARLQGLNVLGRSLRDNTQHVLTRGGSVAAATIGLYMINQDNEEYEDLPDYDKDLYWHFFVGGEHFRLPKPFEIGTAFATYPERLVQYSIEEDKGHEFLWEKLKDGVVTALSFDAFPQVVKPLVDVISNKDSFRDMKIVSGALENAPPEQQFNIFTSDTSKSIAQSMPEGAPDYLRSPMMVDYLLRGYFASWSSFGAMVLDPYTRDPSLPDRPEKLVSQYPVVKRFFRSDMTTSKYADLFYDVRGELDNMNREFNGLLENGRTREARDYLNEMGGFDEARKDIRGYYKQIRAINKQRDLIYMDSKLSASRKQQLISKLYEKRNTLFKEAYLKHSQFYPEYGDR